MSLTPITERLREVMGLDPETLSRIGLRAEVRKRMQARGLETRAAYAALLQEDPEEFRRLADMLVVHETSFFRYPASYTRLTEYVRQRRKRSGQTSLRVLCVACSTGEEPASVAMTLLQAGLEKRDIVVDATDVSERAIRYAREGRYRRRGVLRLSEEIRDRWFEEEGQRFRLDTEILECIRYRRANAMDGQVPGTGQKYDVIFCRNLLIYLVPAAREALLRSLIERLEPGGLLFVGHAEVTAARALGLAMSPPLDAFALCLVPGPARSKPQAPVSRRKSPARAAAPATRTRSPMPPVSLPKPPVASAPPPESILDRAARLADAGDLDQARRILSDLMAKGGANADHYHLLAVIEGARGREAETGNALRRALYLEPEHYPALVQLALLADASGDHGRARRAREKAERVRAAWNAAERGADGGGRP